MKLKQAIILVFLGMAFMVSHAAGQSPAPSAFLPEQMFTFEPVVEGTEVVHDFILQNKGTAPLDIIKLQSG